MTKSEGFLRALYEGKDTSCPGFTSVPGLLGVMDHPKGDYTVSDEPIENWVPWAVENYRRRAACAESLRDDTVPVARLNTGTQVFAAAFGCEVAFPKDSNPCALPLLSSSADADRLEVPDIWNTPQLYRVFELARLVQRELGPDAWLGPCDMQTGFDIAALIWDKSDMFVALCDEEEKEAVKRLAAKCSLLLETFLVELQKEFPQMSLCGCPTVWAPPELGPWPSNDECGSVSSAVFDEFLLPELIRLSERFGSIGMHCCADADHQWRSFEKIPGFYAFNRVSPPGRGPDGFDSAITSLGGPDGPVFVLGWINVEAVEHVLSIAPEGTRFVFQQVVANTEDGARSLERMRALL